MKSNYASHYPTIPFVRVDPDAPTPAYAHEGDAGMDLCAMRNVTLRPGESAKVGCGIAFAIPRGWVGKVYARSGLGMKGLVMKNGTGIIDSTFRGEVQLTLFNNNPQFELVEECPKAKRMFPRLYAWLAGRAGGEPCVLVPNNQTIHVRKGDRVAQIVFQHVGEATLAETDQLDETSRNQGGFGSTGISGGERL